MLDFQQYFNTIKWSMMIGTNSGYQLSEQKAMPENEFADIFRAVAEDVYAETGVYISAVMNATRALYRSEWGCPDGGEFSYTLTGCCNPLYVSTDDYLNALEKVVKRMKIRLCQTALYVEIVPAHCDYYNYEEIQPETD